MGTIADKLNLLLNTKAAIKSAIIGKGQTVADSDPFSAYPAKIQAIETGIQLPTLTNPGTAADLLAGKELIDQNGNQLTGTMPSLTAQTITPGVSDQIIAAGRYLSGAVTVSGDSNLIASNIKSGVSIFGVSGSITPIRYVELSSSDFSVYNGVVKINIPNYETGEHIAALSGVYEVTGTDEKEYTFIFYKSRSNSFSARITFVCFDNSTSKYCGEDVVAVNNETSIILQPSGIGGVTVSSLVVSYSYGYLCMEK